MFGLVCIVQLKLSPWGSFIVTFNSGIFIRTFISPSFGFGSESIGAVNGVSTGPSN